MFLNPDKKMLKDLTAEGHAAIMQAWLDQKLEYYSTSGQWLPQDNQDYLYSGGIYRPKPKPVRVWVTLNQDGSIFGMYEHESMACAMAEDINGTAQKLTPEGA